MEKVSIKWKKMGITFFFWKNIGTRMVSLVFRGFKNHPQSRLVLDAHAVGTTTDRYSSRTTHSDLETYAQRYAFGCGDFAQSLSSAGITPRKRGLSGFGGAALHDFRLVWRPFGVVFLRFGRSVSGFWKPGSGTFDGLRLSRTRRVRKGTAYRFSRAQVQELPPALGQAGRRPCQRSLSGISLPSGRTGGALLTGRVLRVGSLFFVPFPEWSRGGATAYCFSRAQVQELPPALGQADRRPCQRSLSGISLPSGRTGRAPLTGRVLRAGSLFFVPFSEWSCWGATAYCFSRAQVQELPPALGQADRRPCQRSLSGISLPSGRTGGVPLTGRVLRAGSLFFVPFSEWSCWGATAYCFSRAQVQELPPVLGQADRRSCQRSLSGISLPSGRTGGALLTGRVLRAGSSFFVPFPEWSRGGGTAYCFSRAQVQELPPALGQADRRPCQRSLSGISLPSGRTGGAPLTGRVLRAGSSFFGPFPEWSCRGATASVNGVSMPMLRVLVVRSGFCLSVLPACRRFSVFRGESCQGRRMGLPYCQTFCLWEPMLLAP